MNPTAYIRGISYHFPEDVLTNEMIAKEFPEWSVDKIYDKTGIDERHIAKPDETAGDLAFHAAKNLFKDYNIDPQQFDFMLFCTQSPDYVLPTTACLLQDRLGLPTTIGALDFNMGCSGYVYGLGLAKGLIAGGIAKNILLLTGETYSKYIDPQDKSTKTIFGDAATATRISTEGPGCIGETIYGTDGAGGKHLIVKAGGSRFPGIRKENPLNQCENIPETQYIAMNGVDIFNFTLENVPPTIEALLEKANLTRDDVDLFIFHQANKFMLDTLRKVSLIPKNKMVIALEGVGNTVSSSIPIVLRQLADNNQLQPGMTIMLVGFGVGLSWSAAIVRY